MTAKDIVAGVVTPIIIIVSTLSYVASIFTGPFAGALPMAIGYGLISAAVIAFLFAVFSDVPFVIAGPNSKPAAVLAAMGGSHDNPYHRAGSNRRRGFVLILVLVAGTLTTGLVLFLLGIFKMGRWIRFVPSGHCRFHGRGRGGPWPPVNSCSRRLGLVVEPAVAARDRYARAAIARGLRSSARRSSDPALQQFAGLARRDHWRRDCCPRRSPDRQILGERSAFSWMAYGPRPRHPVAWPGAARDHRDGRPIGFPTREWRLRRARGRHRHDPAAQHGCDRGRDAPGPRSRP